MISVDRTESDCQKRNCRMLYSKLTIYQVKNKALKEELRLATAGREVGRRDTMPGDRKGG